MWRMWSSQATKLHKNFGDEPRAMITGPSFLLQTPNRQQTGQCEAAVGDDGRGVIEVDH